MLLQKQLLGISEEKKRKVICCLDNMLSLRDKENKLRNVISGYNWYAEVQSNETFITFSNIHETDEYLHAVTADLELFGYTKKEISSIVRGKGGTFHHDLDFAIRDSQGELFPGIRIKDTRTGEYLDLSQYKKPLSYYPEFSDAQGYLLSEDYGWELNLPVDNMDKLKKVVNTFLRKSSSFLYDERGEIIPETPEQKRLRAPWADAYRLPVLLVGECTNSLAKEFPHFDIATKMVLRENNNEISFVIHKALTALKEMREYRILCEEGFLEEQCLANRAFLNYINLNSLILNI